MSTITKERVAEFIKNPLDNGLTRGEQMDLARIALASLEAEPVGEVVLGEYDDCGCHPDARVACIAADGQADWENFKDGTRLYAAPPSMVVIDERAAFNAWNNDENLPIAGVGAKNAAWLAWQARAKLAAPPAPVVHDDLLNMAASAIEDLLEHTDPSTSYYSGVWADVPGKLRSAMLQAGNSPLIGFDLASAPDCSVEVRYFAPPGYAMVPKEPTNEMLNAWLSEIANWRGHVAGYKAMLEAAPQQEVKP